MLLSTMRVARCARLAVAQTSQRITPALVATSAPRRFFANPAKAANEPPTPPKSEVERVVGQSLPDAPSASKRLAQYPTIYAKSSQLNALSDEDQGRWFEVSEDALEKVLA
jgi:hypothetical protein